MKFIFLTQLEGLLLYKYFPWFLLRFVVFYQEFLKTLQTSVSQKIF